MKCLGRNLDEHCCWILGEVCEFLEENTEAGFRWTCGLRRELGDWDKVLKDKRYIDGPHAAIYAKGGVAEGGNCRDFPEVKCHTCGQGYGNS